MRKILLYTFIFLFAGLKAQSQVKADEYVSFVTMFDIANATKDGFYLNGYVVAIDFSKAKSLNGKKIQVSGKVTIVKAIKDSVVETQGRTIDTKYIALPKIKVLKG